MDSALSARRRIRPGRRALATAVAAGVLVAVTGASAATADTGPGRASAHRPNVLIMLLDDARADAMNAMPRTVSWLANRGISYPRAVVTTPSCCPSRATMFSGRFAHNHNVTAQSAVGRYDHDRTLQHDLDAAGYRTAAVGKIFNGWPSTRRPPHFDNAALTGGGYVSSSFVVDGDTRRAPYATTFIGDQINRYIDSYERDDRQPWMIYAGFTAPHSPYTPEPRYARVVDPWRANPAAREKDRGDKPDWLRPYTVTTAEGAATRQAQLRVMRSVDDAIASVRARLAARGELDNTLVLLLSDNGKFWGEHGLPSKFAPYSAADRVPMLMSWPGHLRAGVRDNRLAAMVDVAPTVLDAVGLRPSFATDGRSLLGDHRRSQVLTEYWHDTANGSIPTWASAYAPGRYRYTELYDAEGEVIDREYYDLDRDPWQLVNLLGDKARGNDPDVGKLARALAAQRRCAGAACW
ncbi:sulfatase-like hydrolase/transferase [Pilimelia columellifera]|uniref:Sulfatase N-terminal domain-containing protein n=1 Tax=Pilimelia columellifera subsp. columellifera TaxID=706583 RepID=A0ABN3NQA0_9ACTN